MNNNETLKSNLSEPSALVGLRHTRKIHFIGIGGAGMCGIAEVLLTQGFMISGSDKSATANTSRLESLGATIFIGHQASWVEDVDVVVISSAIPSTNPEWQAAKAAGIPVIPRAQMLAELMRFRQGVAVAGTHGKTTTTSLIASIFTEAGVDPTYVIGGQLNRSGVNARLGTGPFIIAEADESDASFLRLDPMIAVVTNIDNDHLDTYKGDFSILQQAFRDFIGQVPFYGTVVLCNECETVRTIKDAAVSKVVTYGFDNSATLWASNLRYSAMHTVFDVQGMDIPCTTVELKMTGRHNVLNALAAIAVARDAGLAMEDIVRGLSLFAGIGRRLHQYGNYPLPQGGEVTLMDDYGHHPAEILVTTDGIRAAWPNRRLVMVYQLHRYSRTRDLLSRFVDVLKNIDVVILLPIYSAGEAPIPGIRAESVDEGMHQQGHRHHVVLGSSEELMDCLRATLLPGDILLTQGAGDIGAIAEKIAKEGFMEMVDTGLSS